MMFALTVHFRLSLDFFDSGLYTCTAVARLTLALAKFSCTYMATRQLSGDTAVMTLGIFHGHWTVLHQISQKRCVIRQKLL